MLQNQSFSGFFSLLLFLINGLGLLQKQNHSIIHFVIIGGKNNKLRHCSPERSESKIMGLLTKALVVGKMAGLKL